MAPARASQTKPTNQDTLAALGRLYGGSGIHRDALGRRPALPSEIARTLAQNANDPLFPACLTDQPGCSALPATTSQQNASEV